MHGRVDRFLTIRSQLGPERIAWARGLTGWHKRESPSPANNSIRGGNVTYNSGDAAARR